MLFHPQCHIEAESLQLGHFPLAVSEYSDRDNDDSNQQAH